MTRASAAKGALLAPSLGHAASPDRPHARGLVALSALEKVAAKKHGFVRMSQLRGPFTHLHIDTFVLPSFGEHEGAVPCPSPRYCGRLRM